MGSHIDGTWVLSVFPHWSERALRERLGSHSDQLGAGQGAARMPFSIHPHMLRHATGFKLANQGVDNPVAAALPRAQEYSAHGALYRDEPRSAPGFLEGLMFFAERAAVAFSSSPL